jgi:TPR repeat protein
LFALAGQAIADSLSDANRAYDAGDYAKAAKWYQLAAEQGEAYAQLNLGMMYYRGEGVPQVYKEAVKWYRMSAKQGNANAQYFLGVMYDNGQGVPQNYKEVVKWWRLAAERGNATAQYSLGGMYEHGQGVPQDYVLAYMWTNIAAVNAMEWLDASEFQKIVNYRDSIAKKMTAQQIGNAQELARKCMANKFKGC